MGDGLRDEPGLGSLIDFEHPFDFDAGVERQFGHADGGAGVAARVAQNLDHQVRGAVHDRRKRRESGDGIDEAAEAHAFDDVVEIADGGLQLSEKIDGAEPRGLLADLRRDFRADLALVRIGELAVDAEAELAGDDDQVAGPHERHVIRHGRCRRRKGDAQ